ncbi:hypothetical protein J6590_041707 [Homalodisca vitripennis]|nr:hypothetical protein J6590_041707 [Homalodisca vitripennis]
MNFRLLTLQLPACSCLIVLTSEAFRQQPLHLRYKRCATPRHVGQVLKAFDKWNLEENLNMICMRRPLFPNLTHPEYPVTPEAAQRFLQDYRYVQFISFLS